MERRPLAQTIYDVADELRALALHGLRFATDPYDKARYERALALSARLVAAVEQRDEDEVLALFQDNLFHVSPLAGVEAAVFREEKLLLLRRPNDGLWALPGGLVEIGETLAETAVWELWEEVGVRGKATRLLGIFDSRRTESRTKVHMYHAVFQVETNDIPSESPEATEVGFLAADTLPPLSAGHHIRVPLLFTIAQERGAYIDHSAEP